MPTLQEWRESTAPTLLGLSLQLHEENFLGLLPSQNREGFSETAPVKCQGRKVGSLFIPIPQLAKVSSNEVRLLAKGHPEVRASEKNYHKIDVMCWVV